MIVVKPEDVTTGLKVIDRDLMCDACHDSPIKGDLYL
jgi:hypothetical protein